MTLKRLSYIENAKTLADSGEYTMDINIRDPITTLWIRFKAQNGTTSNKANPPHAAIDSIELIDGSDVLVSLDAYEIVSMAAYKLGFLPYQELTEVAGNEQTAVLPIFFGRFPGDQQYAFDPTRFTNPQIRIKWNLANGGTIAATTWVTATAKLTVIAEIMEGAPAPLGFLTQKEYYSFTSAASGIEYVDLPVDYPHRGLFIRASKAATYFMAGIGNIKITADQGKFIPFDMGTVEYLRWLTMRYPPFQYKHEFWCVNGDTLYPILKYDENVVPSANGGGDHTVQYPNTGEGEGAVDLRSAGSAETGLHQVNATVFGWAPFGGIYLPWGDPMTPADWLPAGLFKSLRLELTNNAASASVWVAIEQLRTY